MHTTAGDVSPRVPSGDAPGPVAWWTDASLFLMAAIWGVNFVVVKFATSIVAPLAFNSLRVALAATALLIIAAVRGGPWPNRRQTVALIGLGVLGNGVYQVCFIEGISMTRAGDASLLIAATPAFIALLGRFRGIEVIRPKGWIGILMSIAGIGLVSSAAALTDERSSLLGDLLILSGSLCWAIYTVLLKPYMHTVDGIKMAGLTMLGGALALLAFAWRSVVETSWSAAPSAIWGAMAYSGIGALVVAYFFWYRGVRLIGPTRTAMYSNLQPIIAVVVAAIALHETPTLWQGVGAASIMSGLILTRS